MGLLAFFTGGNLSNGNGRGTEKVEDKYTQAQEDPNSLGNILIELGYVTPDTLERAIKIQKSQSLLGRILVNMKPEEGGITEEQLQEALLEQKIRRRKAKPLEVIKANSEKHTRLVKEVNDQLTSLEKKYVAAGKE